MDELKAWLTTLDTVRTSHLWPAIALLEKEFPGLPSPAVIFSEYDSQTIAMQWGETDFVICIDLYPHGVAEFFSRINGVSFGIDNPALPLFNILHNKTVRYQINQLR
jgi:hypothetical protein